MKSCRILALCFALLLAVGIAGAQYQQGLLTSITATSPLTGGTITTNGSIGCPTASGAQAGCLSAADWTKFNSAGGGGVTSIATTDPITGGPITTTGTIACNVASGLQAGCLSAADWTTFNSKQSALTLPLTVANGGTGLATLPIHAVLLGAATSNVANVAAMAADTLLQGKGATSDPAAVSVVNCGDGTHALAYSTTTHLFTCQTISVGGSGTVTSIATTAPITGGTITGTGTIACNVASGSQPGCLASADWTTFNNKVSGPVSSTVGDFAIWNNTGGTVVKDQGGFPALYVNDNFTLATASSVAVTLSPAPVVGHTVLVFIEATTRGSTGVTETNVAFSKVLSTTGNSQVAELWIGTVSASASTTITAAFASSALTQVNAVEVGQLFTAVGASKTGTGITGTTSEAAVFGGLTPNIGDYVVACFSFSGGQGGILSVPGTPGFFMTQSLANGSGYIGRAFSNLFQPEMLKTGTSTLNWAGFYAVIS